MTHVISATESLSSMLGSCSPTNIDDAAFLYQESRFISPCNFHQSLPASSPSLSHTTQPATSIAAIAREFQESKLSEIKSLVNGKVPVVLVTTCQWDYVPLMYEGLHFVYEGKLVDVQTDGQSRNFTMRLDYPNRKAPICVQFSCSDVVSLLPRFGQRNRSEDCSYFHLHGHCAFGLNCHKAHDPRKLCDKVKERLRCGDIKILNENQQHTLHIAMVEEKMSESEMRSYFDPFGPLKSVKIEPGKTLLQGQSWRIGFVTYHHAKDAIKAKKVLNEDPKSKFRGLIQFSKQPTKNHASTPAYVHQSHDLALPRSTSNPRLDKPTEQLYLHRLPKGMPTTFEEVRDLLHENSLTSYIDITASGNRDYALVLFDNVQDGIIACHTLLACSNRQWALDFQPVEDRVHLKIRFHRWLTLRREETCLLRHISSHWDNFFNKSEELHIEKEVLYNELNQVRRELLEADDNLTKLVFQAARQASTQIQRECQSMDIINLASTIGPDAVAYTEEKLGGLREFLDGQRQSTIFNIEENLSPPNKVDSSETCFPPADTKIGADLEWSSGSGPKIYKKLLWHVTASQLLPIEPMEG